MEKIPIPVGVREIAQNCRLILVLCFGTVIFEQYLLSTGLAYPTWSMKLSLASLLIGAFAGITVLLKQPFGEERQSNLDASVHKGLNLFYGAELGGFTVGFIVFGASFIFG